MTCISIHGWQYSKIFLLALASHSLCVLLASTFRRARDSRSIVNLAKIWWFPTSQLDFWATYYFGCVGHWPTVCEINHIILGFLSQLRFLEVYDSVYISVVIGPVIIHVAVTCIATLFLGLFGIPATARVVIRDLSDRARLFLFLSLSIGATALIVIYCSISFAYFQYLMLIPEIQQSIWDSFSSAESRETVRGAFWWLVAHHRSWKSRQIEDLRDLVSGLQTFFSAIFLFGLETWGTLHSVHKLVSFPFLLPLRFLTNFTNSLSLPPPFTTAICTSSRMLAGFRDV
ncbi:hypothetical protein C8R44DRAFT_980788 [Mycena epipterygia]|nr:hypothetical protein C8R44DRAFT_980788 [Mycena epipterygia]